MKKAMSLMLALTMAASLAACNGTGGAADGKTGGAANETTGGDAPAPSQAGNGETKKPGEGQTIEIWTQWTSGSDKETYSLEMIKQFEEETGYKVNCTNFTYEMLHEKILTAAAGGNVPDCAYGLPEYIGEFYNMGILED